MEAASARGANEAEITAVQGEDCVDAFALGKVDECSIGEL